MIYGRGMRMLKSYSCFLRMLKSMPLYWLIFPANPLSDVGDHFLEHSQSTATCIPFTLVHFFIFSDNCFSTNAFTSFYVDLYDESASTAYDEYEKYDGLKSVPVLRITSHSYQFKKSIDESVFNTIIQMSRR